MTSVGIKYQALVENYVIFRYLWITLSILFKMRSAVSYQVRNPFPLNRNRFKLNSASHRPKNSLPGELLGI
jgi:hypothetical protein